MLYIWSLGLRIRCNGHSTKSHTREKACFWCSTNYKAQTFSMTLQYHQYVMVSLVKILLKNYYILIFIINMLFVFVFCYLTFKEIIILYAKIIVSFIVVILSQRVIIYRLICKNATKNSSSQYIGQWLFSKNWTLNSATFFSVDKILIRVMKFLFFTM